MNSSEFQTHRSNKALLVSHLVKSHTSHSADHLIAVLRWHEVVQEINLEDATPNTINWLLPRGLAAWFVPVWWLSGASLGSIIRQDVTPSRD